jgi:dTMP kinase
MATAPDLKLHRQNQERLRELLRRHENQRGFLIAFEGPDGAGKTTQRRLFKKWLETEKHEVIGVKWASSPLVKPIIKARKGARALSPQEHCLLYAADFRHSLECVILPAVWEGKVVIADGYLFTGLARAGARGVKLNWILNCYEPLFWPDVAFYFDISPETSGRRVTSRRTPKFYDAGQDVTNIEDPYESYRHYLTRMRQEYRALASIFQMITVDAEQSIYEQHRSIRQVFRQATRRPWAEWNIDALLEWLDRRQRSDEVQGAF